MIIAVLNANQSKDYGDFVDLMVISPSGLRFMWGSVSIYMFSDEWGLQSPEYAALKNGEEVPFEMKARV